MKDTAIVLLTAFAVGLLIFAVLASQRPAVLETEDYIWKEKKSTVIPGFAIGIPTSTVEFKTIKVRVADVVLKRNIDVSVLLEGKKDTVLLLTVKSAKAGLLVLAVDKRLKDYAKNIAAVFGLGEYEPDENKHVGNHIVFVFYGIEEE